MIYNQEELLLREIMQHIRQTIMLSLTSSSEKSFFFSQ